MIHHDIPVTPAPARAFAKRGGRLCHHPVEDLPGGANQAGQPGRLLCRYRLRVSRRRLRGHPEVSGRAADPFHDLEVVYGYRGKRHGGRFRDLDVAPGVGGERFEGGGLALAGAGPTGPVEG
ncbi:MAG: hypothetical protein E6I22_08780 [Chloroflexi bacterium]|nr:MAG: hypothetical protein E6I22_08780 [Chloroflexota bacterium]